MDSIWNSYLKEEDLHDKLISEKNQKKRIYKSLLNVFYMQCLCRLTYNHNKSQFTLLHETIDNMYTSESKAF